MSDLGSRKRFPRSERFHDQHMDADRVTLADGDRKMTPGHATRFQDAAFRPDNQPVVRNPIAMIARDRFPPHGWRRWGRSAYGWRNTRLPMSRGLGGSLDRPRCQTPLEVVEIVIVEAGIGTGNGCKGLIDLLVTDPAFTERLIVANELHR